MTFEPLAERLRPKSLDEYIGQKHLVGEGCILRKMIESGHISSFILWGPPGVGKTTLAKIIASQVQAPFYTLSAVHSGVKDVRDVLTLCKRDASSMFSQHRPILFIDDCRRVGILIAHGVLQGAQKRGGNRRQNREECETLNPLYRHDFRTISRTLATEVAR